MKAIAKLASCLAGAMLVSVGSAAAATGCPRFLAAAGYGDLCMPSAWMAFEHQGGQDNNKARKIKRHDQKADNASKPKTKIRKPKPKK